MNKQPTKSPASAQHNRIQVTMLDVIVVVSVLLIAFVVASVYAGSVGYSIAVAFCCALAIRDAIIAPYKVERSNKIKTLFVSCLILGATGLAIALTLDPQARLFIGGLGGLAIAFGLYTASSLWKQMRHR